MKIPQKNPAFENHIKSVPFHAPFCLTSGRTCRKNQNTLIFTAFAMPRNGKSYMNTKEYGAPEIKMSKFILYSSQLALSLS
jgi:hypothetical protein